MKIIYSKIGKKTTTNTVFYCGRNPKMPNFKNLGNPFFLAQNEVKGTAANKFKLWLKSPESKLYRQRLFKYVQELKKDNIQELTLQCHCNDISTCHCNYIKTLIEYWYNKI